MRYFVRLAGFPVAIAALVGSQPSWACRMAPDVAAQFAAKYSDKSRKEDKPFFESVVLARVADAAQITKESSGIEFWAGTATIVRTLSGPKIDKKVGLAQVMVDDCHESFATPVSGDPWVIYYVRDPSRHQYALWPESYPLSYVLRFDPRVRAAIERNGKFTPADQSSPAAR